MRAAVLAVALLLPPLATPSARAAPIVAVPAAEAPPFAIDLPRGFVVAKRPPGPDFDVYDVRKGDVGYVGIYVGCCASFPVKDGVQVKTKSKGVKVALRDGRIVEYLLSHEGRWGQTHVWVQEGEGVDRAVADRIAASIRLR